jgi:hypothetical protein
VKTALLMVAAPAGIALAGIVADLGSPLLAGIGVSGAWVLALVAVLATRALRDLAPHSTEPVDPQLHDLEPYDPQSHDLDPRDPMPLDTEPHHPAPTEVPDAQQ